MEIPITITVTSNETNMSVKLLLILTKNFCRWITEIKSIWLVICEAGLFLCSWLTYGIAMACLWLRSGKQEPSAQVPSFHATCGPDHHTMHGRCRPDLGRHKVSIRVIFEPRTFQHSRGLTLDVLEIVMEAWAQLLNCQLEIWIHGGRK